MPANRTLLEQVAHAIAPDATAIEHLGTGGFASTFKVTSPDGSIHALKVVDALLSDEKRVARELDALQRVDHPNVVRYLDNGIAIHNGDTFRWLTMEYVDGQSLKSVLEAGRQFTLSEAVSVLRQAVSGAAALWAADTAHRDLSPNNLMLTAGDQLVIVDLGMARHLDDETITNLPTPGTPGWMSPEQVSATPTHGDYRSDEFVLGLVGYRLVTGIEVITSTGLARWQAPALVNPRPAHELRSGVPLALSALLGKMLARQPARRYLRPEALLTDLETIAASLSAVTETDDVPAHFYLSIGTAKTYAARPGFIAQLAPAGLVLDARASGRIDEFFALAEPATSVRVVDPFTYLSRSPLQHRPTRYTELTYGGGNAVLGFSGDEERNAYCGSVLDLQLSYAPDVVLAPYFYAGSGEQDWIRESLRCAVATSELLIERAPERGGLVEPTWTTVAIAASWLANEQHRETLLNELTSGSIETLHLLVKTTQGSFAPLSDLSVLTGLSDVISVMREAGVPLILGRRSSEGLVGLALGASGWTSGVAGVQQNMEPHPEEETRGGPGNDRIYLPDLLLAVTTATYAQFAAADADVILGVNTSYGLQLLEQNPQLENLTTEQRILLLQHNMTAMRAQASALADLDSGGRLVQMRNWVAAAQARFRVLPTSPSASETDAFLASWATVLA